MAILPGFTVVTTGNQTEEGTGKSAEAALGAGEAGGRKEADGSPPAQDRAGVCRGHLGSSRRVGLLLSQASMESPENQRGVPCREPLVIDHARLKLPDPHL